ncbi:hypothetical protein QL285_026022 [Trifolium repens]|nr:hypothetical protein QL285_026022 [Trifolium repens]
MEEVDLWWPAMENGCRKEEHARQRGKFFMVLALAGLPPDLDSVRNQILSSAAVPSYDTVCEQLLRLSTPTPAAPTVAASHNMSVDSTALVSNSYQRGGRGGGRRNNRYRSHCDYCNRYGHIEAECRTKANQLQPKVVNVAQIEASNTSGQVSLSTTEYNEYLKLKAQMQTTTPVASVSQNGNPNAFVSQSSCSGLENSILRNAMKSPLTFIYPGGGKENITKTLV